MPVWAIVLIVIAIVICVDVLVLVALGSKMRKSLENSPTSAGNQAFWDRFASMYAPAMGKTDPAYDEVSDQLADVITPEMNVLEIACGSGQFTGRLAGRVNSWIATDFSPAMIEEAQEADLPENVELKVADATDLPFDDGAFDAVLIGNALHIISNPEAALAEAHRVLIDGGLLLAPTFVQKRGKRPALLVSVAHYLGMRTYHDWDAEELANFIASQGFLIEEESLVDATPLPICVVIARREEAGEESADSPEATEHADGK